jgi:phospholipase C
MEVVATDGRLGAQRATRDRRRCRDRKALRHVEIPTLGRGVHLLGLTLRRVRIVNEAAERVASAHGSGYGVASRRSQRAEKARPLRSARQLVKHKCLSDKTADVTLRVTLWPTSPPACGERGASRSVAQAMKPTAAAPLQRIKHIVVLQLENRSFDHMLGYLALPGNELPARENEFPSSVNGLNGATNIYQGITYSAEPLNEDAFDGHRLDPPHDAPEVDRQIAAGAMTGFVETWARKLHKKNGWFLRRSAKRLWARVRHKPYPDPADLKAVMGYLTRDKLPVFDHLARHFCVCDSWFCSVAGPTMPNRFFSVAGTHDGEMSNVKLLFFKRGKFKSLFRELQRQDMWRWYSSDPGILRAVDGTYRLDIDPTYDHFAYFDECTEVQPRTFLSDIQDGELPEVAWIDPNFAIKDMVKRVGGYLDGPGSNDDHPPSRVIEAQKLVNKVYEALGRSQYWDDTLFVIYYDEHGGFHDHEPPPAVGIGPRIPAIVIGGRVKRGVCQVQFDHASLIKTILLRFGKDGCEARMPDAVESASDLSVVLRDDDQVVPFVPVVNAGAAAVTDEELQPRMLEHGASRATRAIEFLEEALTDLQILIVKHHALPLRTGRDKLSRLPTMRLAKLAIKAAPEKPIEERLPPRRP